MDRVPSLRGGQRRVGPPQREDHPLCDVELEDVRGRAGIIDWNYLWDAPQLIEYMMLLAEIKPWSTAEPEECVLAYIFRRRVVQGRWPCHETYYAEVQTQKGHLGRKDRDRGVTS